MLKEDINKQIKVYLILEDKKSHGRYESGWL